MTKAIDRFISIQAQHFMRTCCKSLQRLGIVNFSHDMTFPKGELAMLTTDANIFRLYFKERIPAVCTDENGRTLKPGVYLRQSLMKAHPDCSILLPKILPKFKAESMLLIAENDVDCQHFYTILSLQQEAEFLQNVVNNIHYIKNFLVRYRRQAQEVILEAKRPSNRIVLPLSKHLILPNSFKQQSETNPQESSCIFHKTTKLPVHLSPQQNRCFLLLMEGKSAKQIAGVMELSPRTVEHYLERLRELLDCHSNRELLASYSHCLNQVP